MIKKAINLFIAGIISFLVLSPAGAQVSTSGSTSSNQNKEKDFKFTVKINPLAALGGPFWVIIVPITGEYKLLLEAKLSKRISFQVAGGYIGPSVLINLNKLTTDSSGVSGIKTGGYLISGMLKFFLSSDLPAPKGFYVGPQVSYASAKITDKSASSNYLGATKLNINADIGYQLITSGGFCLDIFTGIGYVSRKWNVNGETGIWSGITNKSGVTIPLGFSFGYAF
jgi:hypothetical protein